MAKSVGGMAIGQGAFLLAVCVVLAVWACDKIDLDSTSSSSSSSETGSVAFVMPYGHGLGTQERPLTPEELMGGTQPQNKDMCWVMGYAVGSAYNSIKNAVFEIPTTNTNNILLASDSLCEDYEQCIPTRLTTNAMKDQFSLAYNEECFRQFVVLCGTYGTYYSTCGLTKVTQGYWIPGFDMTTIAPPPEEWDIWYMTTSER